MKKIMLVVALSGLLISGMGLISRYGKYDTARGVEDDQNALIEQALNGSGFSLILNTVYHF